MDNKNNRKWYQSMSIKYDQNNQEDKEQKWSNELTSQS